MHTNKNKGRFQMATNDMSAVLKAISEMKKDILVEVDKRISGNASAATVQGKATHTPAAKAAKETNIFNVTECLPSSILLDDPMSTNGHANKLLFCKDKQGFNFTVKIYSSRPRKEE
jgi:hypothetical protein